MEKVVFKNAQDTWLDHPNLSVCTSHKCVCEGQRESKFSLPSYCLISIVETVRRLQNRSLTGLLYLIKNTLKAKVIKLAVMCQQMLRNVHLKYLYH